MTDIADGAAFEIEIDEEQVCRIVGHDPDELVYFTVGDFNRFLTEFMATVILGLEDPEPDE